MALNEIDLRKLEIKAKRYRTSLGESLYLDIYPTGGKYFVWKYRFPPGKTAQQRWYQIGPYGKGAGKWTLMQAVREKNRLDEYRRQGNDPRILKIEQRKAIQLNAIRIGTSNRKLFPNILNDVYIHETANIANNAIIRKGSKIWINVQIRENSFIGKNCIVGKDVYIDASVRIGNRCKIQNGVYIYTINAWLQ